MILSDHYERALERHGFTRDPAQAEAVRALQETYAELCGQSGGLTKLLAKLPGLSRLVGTPSPAKGVYLWGGVGRGKTFVMDVFFEALPFDEKLRFHFHRLMYRVHNRLKELRGESDPLEIVADELASQARIICFDEFFVSDIGDAMILGKLLKGLFNRGVCLVATSNTPPDKLYMDGLQRQRFIPAINLLELHTRVLKLDNGNDYRLRVLSQAEIWHAPLDAAADRNMETYFAAIAPEDGTAEKTIEILGRSLQTRRRADGIVWFDFAELCDGPRSQNDYIEIAREFQTVLLSNAPQLTAESENQARRFIALIDEFYDRKVKLIVSAACPVNDIYRGKKLAREFERAASRLLEMQSTKYLASPHLP